MKTPYIRTQNDMKKLCFLSTVRIIPIPIVSSSPDLSSSQQNTFPSFFRKNAQWCAILPLTITVTGSYRIFTGFSMNPFETYNGWF